MFDTVTYFRSPLFLLAFLCIGMVKSHHFTARPRCRIRLTDAESYRILAACAAVDSTPARQSVVESGPLPAMKDTTPLLLALGATATVAWLFAKRRKRMSQLPTAFGDPSVQQRFIMSHQAFLLEVPVLEQTVE